MSFHDMATRLEDDEALDPLTDAVERLIPEALLDGPLHEQLAGRWLGHALHPLLTDLPLGAWTGATLIDVLGRRSWRPASTFLTGIGLLAAAPTVAAGMAEWAHGDRRQHRVMSVHAALNACGTVCYLVSFVAKQRGRGRLGVGAAVAGGVLASLGGYLGGHLSFVRGVGVDPTGHGAAPSADEVIDGGADG